MLSPIVVFAYNRPEHLSKVLNALSENYLANQSDLYIYVDGPKTEEGKKIQDEVLKVCSSVKPAAFKTVSVIASEKNKGLSQSVISGVSKIINEYGKVIVVEDDSVTDRFFLRFMNDALDFYCDNNQIWSIGGYTVPLALPDNYKYDVIETQRVSSYAWATWKDRWEKIDWNVPEYKSFRFDFTQRKRFNLWGEDRSSMLDDQMLGRINSWAIRFDYYMFKYEMYNIVPRFSLVRNIGHDGSGTHNGMQPEDKDPFAVENIRHNRNLILENVECIEEIRTEFCKPFKVSEAVRTKRYIGNIVREVLRRD